MSTIEDESGDGMDRRLARRIKAERERHGWSLAELALRSGVSRAMISKVERGTSSPTAALLGRLSGAFGLTLSQLLAGAEGGAGRLSRRAEQTVWRDPATGFERRTLTPPGAATPLELVASELPPGAGIAYPAAAFRFIDQQIVALDGCLTFVQGEAVHRLQAGDCLHLGPPADCRFRNDGPDPCRYLVAVLRRDR